LSSATIGVLGSGTSKNASSAGTERDAVFFRLVVEDDGADSAFLLPGDNGADDIFGDAGASPSTLRKLLAAEDAVPFPLVVCGALVVLAVSAFAGTEGLSTAPVGDSGGAGSIGGEQ
jgi:hypothetical protein